MKIYFYVKIDFGSARVARLEALNDVVQKFAVTCCFDEDDRSFLWRILEQASQDTWVMNEVFLSARDLANWV